MKSGLSPVIDVILLAAGASRRMAGKDKLLELINGTALLRLAATEAAKAQVNEVHVVLPPDNSARHQAISGLAVNRVKSPNWAEGMAASIKAGMARISPDCDAVIIALADMPDITTDHFNRLITVFDPAKSRSICRAVTSDGTPGLPVLFGAQFFEKLKSLHGDHGARDIIKDEKCYLTDVPTRGQAAITDLDTPQAWAKWRARHEPNQN